jgi:hypothetical protein
VRIINQFGKYVYGYNKEIYSMVQEGVSRKIIDGKSVLLKDNYMDEDQVVIIVEVDFEREAQEHP